MRTHYGPWQPCWISNQHQKHKSGRGPSSEHFWQVWLKSVQRFQRRRFKCEKLTDGRTLTHDKSSHGLWPGELKTNYLTLRSKSHEGHYGMWHTALWSCTHWIFSSESTWQIEPKRDMIWMFIEWFPTKTYVVVSKEGVSILYMDFNYVTKYNWPIWKDKQVMVQTSFAEKKQKQKKKSD
jgi:hypothetical protein